jgi:hypothetical protein
MKGLRFATRCATLDQFIALFSRLCDGKSIFVSTMGTRPAGLETAFSIDLADGTPALRGLGVVLGSWDTLANPFGRPGIKLGLRRLTKDTEKTLERLVAARAAADADRQAAPNAPADSANTDVIEPPPPPSSEERAPGADLVLPANPLMGIADKSLEGFVDCTIYEETGNFFPIDPPLEDPDDPVADPPLLAPLPRRPTPAPLPPGAAAEAAPRVPAAPPAPSPPSSAVAAAPLAAPPPVPPPRAASAPAAEPAGMPPPSAAASPTEDLDALRPGLWERISALFRGSRRWWLIGGAVAVVIVVVVIVVAARSGQGRPERVAMQLPPAVDAGAAAAVTPPPPPVPPPPAAVPHDPAPEQDTGPGGMPVVGAGPCRVAVTSTPAGSTVEVDGERVGPSPIAIAGPCQKRIFVLSHPRYETATRTVTPDPAKPSTLDVTLSRPMHHLMIETQPSGAIISIAGHAAGVSPTNVDVLGFTAIDVTITKPTYKPMTKRVYSRVANDHLSVSLTR